MLAHTHLRTRYVCWTSAGLVTAIVLALAAYAASKLASSALSTVWIPTFVSMWCAMASTWLAIASVVAAVAVLVSFLVRFGAFHGWRYFKLCLRTLPRLRHALLDAGYGIARDGLLGDYEELPKIRLAVDGEAVTLHVENSIRFDKKLDGVDPSSALRGFVLERSYLTDDRSWYVFELVDASFDFHLAFDTIDEFEEYARNRCDRYHLFLDGRTVVPLSSALAVGETGSGKSYALYSLILQLRAKGATLCLCDPKASGVAVMGRRICPDRTATSLDGITALLEGFVSAMEKRKVELGVRLEERLDATYADFGLKPHVLVIDEYASVMYELKSCDKKTRDHFTALVAEVVLQGRQLGFFLLIAMQKSDATLIDTAMRENLPLMVVLGNAKPMTLTTSLGAGVDVPRRDNASGEGVFTEPHVAPSPKLVQFPDLRFLARGVDPSGKGTL